MEDNQTQQNTPQYVFQIEGYYTKVIKEMFSCLAKSAEKNSDFHILVNLNSIAFIINQKGNITSTVLQLKDKFFNQIKFEPNCSNTASGFVMKVNMEDFDLCYKLLDPGQENKIVIEYEQDSSHLLIKQNNATTEGITTQKTIKLDIMEEQQEEKDRISLSFIPDAQQYPIKLKFQNGNAFKLVEKAFGAIKLDNLVFNIDFQDNNSNKFTIESDLEDQSEIFKVNLSKFNRIKRDVFLTKKFSYQSKLILPAFSFFSKQTEIYMNIDENGNLYIISEDLTNNVKTETVIPENYDASNQI